MKNTITFILLVITIAAHAQTIDKNKLDDYINHISKNNRDIGSISIFKDGKEVYNKSFGQSSLPNSKFKPNTRYQVGSISKVFTATLIFKAIEQGKITLDDRLNKWYPQIKNDQNISLKNLLEHSSGLGDYTTKNDTIFWLKEKVADTAILSEIVRQDTTFAAGTNTRYSNSAYYLLTKIVEKLYNKPFANIIEQEFIKPLKLQNLASAAKADKNIFSSYEFTDKWVIEKEFEFTNVIGVGDISACMYDLNVFITALFEGKIISEKSLAIMKPTSSELFGRGMMLIPFYDILFYGHGGDTYGTHSLMSYNPESKIAISISINGERYPHNDFAVGILSIIYGKEYKFPEFKESIAITSSELDQYQGLYSSPEVPIKINIFKKDNVLYGQGTGQPEFPLEYLGNNVFKYVQAGIEIEFKVTEKVMVFKQGGAVFNMTKE